MCVGDWRFGRLIRCRGYHALTGAGGSFSLNSNMQRVGITIVAKQLADIVSVSVTTSNGTFSFPDLTADLRILHFTLLTHGELPTYRFNVADGGAGSICELFEYTCEEAVLQQAYELLRQDYPGFKL